MALIEKMEKVLVTREIREYKGEFYANYYVNIKIKTFDDRTKEIVTIDKPIRLDIPRGDIGMYDVLSMVFMGQKEKELFRVSTTTTDYNGKKKTTNRYEVYSDDKELVGVLVPQGESNKALLESVFKSVLANEENDTNEEE